MGRPAETPERAATIVAWVAIAGGFAARAWALSQRGSLWLDEASLALNVMTRSFGELLRPLDWSQAAPIGFLWLERAAAWHADVPDVWLRLVPFVSGAMLPWLLWQLGRRFVGYGAGAFAAVMAAGSMLSLRYSTEAKPYASDAAVAAVLLLLASDALDEPRTRAWRRLAAAMLLAVFVSLPAVFVVAGIAVSLAAHRKARASRGARRVAVPALALTGAFVAALWMLSYRHSAANASLRAYWAPVMLDLTADDRVLRIVRVLMELTWIPLRWTGSLVGTAVGLALWGGGIGMIARRRPAEAMLLASPVAFAMAASVMGAYPLSDRLAFFAVPGIWLAQAAALIGVRNALLTSRSVVANARAAAAYVALVAIAIATWQYTDADRFLNAPGSLEPTRALFAQVDVDAGSAPVYVFARAVPAWLMATHDGPWRGDARLSRWTSLAGRPGSPGYENAARTRPVTVGEGDSLVVVTSVRTELVGLATGVEYHIAGAPSAAAPSPGWAAEEARRMVAAARPHVWLVASHFFAGSTRNELRPLVEALEAAGLHMVEERHVGNDVIALHLSR